MDVALSAAFALGFLNGFRHAFEPDHVLAVSTMVHRTPRLTRALHLGLAWGAGHTTLLMATVLGVGLLRVRVPEALLGYLEIPVAIMLFGLGVAALYDAAKRIATLRRHRHDGVAHFHVGAPSHPHHLPGRQSLWSGYAVGMVHGLAGSGALLLLVAATLPTVTASLFYALIFGAGSVLGMGLVTLSLALALLASRTRPTLYHALTGLSGALSILLGASILYAAWPH